MRKLLGVFLLAVLFVPEVSFASPIANVNCVWQQDYFECTITRKNGSIDVVWVFREGQPAQPPKPGKKLLSSLSGEEQLLVKDATKKTRR